VDFEIISEIVGIETFTRGLGVQIRDYLNHRYAGGRRVRWRKRKGFATVRYDNGDIMPKCIGLKATGLAG
jgi:hypothetical protein